MELARSSSLGNEMLRLLAMHLIAEFGHLYPAWDQVAATTELAQDPGEGLPLHIVAIDDGFLRGIASIIPDDEVTGWEAESWWLANVMVLPEYRNRGVGSTLIQGAVERARERGVHDLHLVTDTAESWYRKHRWESVGTGEVHGHQMIVMRLDLRTN
jgi:GNAT superfamily N-acetyltransferase